MIKNLVIQEIKPLFCTTLDPSEYNINKQMEDMVKLANKYKKAYVEMDVGKVWGLYLAWKQLQVK